ncbi:DUF2970 domain-containing protein [Gallaecimonas kandeliae]|uniref:DUF2970 domain-containing protein n=1 Tax=Gallaecimonas kandeliae TaxID=3029055 RepID=UPI002647FC9C|nr:DUF2970 domain-containing protein [Gallaecimonas kandeliae]WKE65278.1 DUF2970 domain-containing protein [Gallaecimonas kandeliae]
MPAKSTPKKRNLFLSVAGALFGVQSSSRHATDLESRSALSYIIAGVVGIALFVIALLLVVNWVLH